MTFAAPLALLWGLLALPIIALYILRVRLRRVPVATNQFWEQVFSDRTPRAWWRHLRHLISLAVQLLLLAALVLALSEPLFAWQQKAARRVVLVLDNSASMQAADGSGTRFASAQAEARGIVDSLRPQDDMAIVAAGGQPQVVCPLTSHPRTLRAAIEELAAADGPTRIADSVALARRLIDPQRRGEIVVVSDACAPSGEEWQKATDVRVIPVGSALDNVAITQFQVRRNLTDPIGYDVLVEVVNLGAKPVACRIELDLNDEVVDVIPLELEPDKPWSRVFDKTSADGGVLRARLDAADALPADNQSLALLPKREPVDVLLVTEGNWFLEKVLAAQPLVRLQVVQQLPSPLPARAIVILHRQVPEKLPSAPTLVIDPTNGCEAWTVGAVLQDPIVTQQDRQSPLLAHVRLDNVLMPEARRLEFSGPAQTLVGAVGGEPLYASLERKGGKVLVLSVNIDQGDLPLRTAFPILVSNALSWFAGARGELRESLASGDVTRLEAPTSGAGPWALESPTGERRPLPSGQPRWEIGPLDRCGVWRVVRAAPPEAKPSPDDKHEVAAEVACNLANRRESDLRPLPELNAAQPAAVSLASALSRPNWFYLLAAGCLLAVLEWPAYQRRWIT